MNNRIKINIETEFFCTTCGKKTKKIEACQTNVWINSHCVLPCRPDLIKLEQICKLCLDEIENIKNNQSEEVKIFILELEEEEKENRLRK